MIRSEICLRVLKLSMVLALTAAVAGCGGGEDDADSPGATAKRPLVPGAGQGVGGMGHGPTPIDLQNAGTFAVLAETAIDNAPTSSVSGNVGLSPGSGSAIALSCDEVSGTVYTTGGGPRGGCSRVDVPRLNDAVGSAIGAYNDGISRTPDYKEVGAGNLGGLVLPPATYKWSGSVRIPTKLTLKGGPNDVWILLATEDLTVGAGVQIVLEGGALPQNVYWLTLVHGFDIGAGAQFQGIIMSETSISMGTGASINGRLLAATSITLDQNTVVAP